VLFKCLSDPQLPQLLHLLSTVTPPHFSRAPPVIPFDPSTLHIIRYFITPLHHPTICQLSAILQMSSSPLPEQYSPSPSPPDRTCLRSLCADRNFTFGQYTLETPCGQVKAYWWKEVEEELRRKECRQVRLKLHELLGVEAQAIQHRADALAQLSDYVKLMAREEAKVDISTVLLDPNALGADNGVVRPDVTVLSGPNHFHQLTAVEVASDKYGGELLEGQVFKMAQFCVDVLQSGRRYNSELQSVSGFVVPNWRVNRPGHLFRVRASVGDELVFGIRLNFRILRSNEEFKEELKVALQNKVVLEDSVATRYDDFISRLTEAQLQTIANKMSELKPGSEFSCTQLPSVCAILVEAIERKTHGEHEPSVL